jgi:hypothetical protein
LEGGLFLFKEKAMIELINIQDPALMHIPAKYRHIVEKAIAHYIGHPQSNHTSLTEVWVKRIILKDTHKAT